MKRTMLVCDKHQDAIAQHTFFLRVPPSKPARVDLCAECVALPISSLLGAVGATAQTNGAHARGFYPARVLGLLRSAGRALPGKEIVRRLEISQDIVYPTLGRLIAKGAVRARGSRGSRVYGVAA